jgi:hypothetical protein
MTPTVAERHGVRGTLQDRHDFRSRGLGRGTDHPQAVGGLHAHQEARIVQKSPQGGDLLGDIHVHHWPGTHSAAGQVHQITVASPEL